MLFNIRYVSVGFRLVKYLFMFELISVKNKASLISVVLCLKH